MLVFPDLSSSGTVLSGTLLWSLLSAVILTLVLIPQWLLVLLLCLWSSLLGVTHFFTTSSAFLEKSRDMHSLLNHTILCPTHPSKFCCLLFMEKIKGLTCAFLKLLTLPLINSPTPIFIQANCFSTGKGCTTSNKSRIYFILNVNFVFL